METADDWWVLFMSSGLLLVIVGMLFQGELPWYIQYGILGSGLVMCSFAVTLSR